MRVSDKMTYDQVKLNLNRNRSEMAELQNQAATQKRINKPSDDPVAASRALASRVDIQGTEQFLKNLDFAKSFLEFTDQSLGELTDHLNRVKELAIGQANDATANPQTRRVVATEIGQIYNQIFKIANRKMGDRYIFGGYNTLKNPFDMTGRYNGDSGEMLIPVDKTSFIPMNIPGSKVFLGIGLSADGITHSTMQQPQTVEELEQQLAANQVNQPNPQTQLRESTEPTMAKSVGMRGPASTRTADVQMSGTGEAGVDLFKVVKKLEIAMEANDKQGVQDSLEQLDAAMEQVILARSQVGSRSMVLNNSLDTLQKSKIDSQTMVSQLEDADVFSLISDINKTESTLQATLATSGKLIQPSLLKYLG